MALKRSGVRIPSAPPVRGIRWMRRADLESCIKVVLPSGYSSPSASVWLRTGPAGGCSLLCAQSFLLTVSISTIPQNGRGGAILNETIGDIEIPIMTWDCSPMP